MKSAIAIILGLSLAALPAAAQLSVSGDAPIDVSSEGAEFKDNKAIWTGNVRVVQEESILSADRIEADLTEDGDFTTITAVGNVRYSNGKEAITGKRAVFDNAARKITVYEDVIVTQGKQVMSAGSVIYWIDSGKVKFLPPPGQRVRGVFYTKKDDQT